MNARTFRKEASLTIEQLNTLTPKQQLAAFAEKLSDAYSTDRYQGGWGPCIKMMERRGYSDMAIEAVIRSKWTRWAADASGKPYGRATSSDLARFLENLKSESRQVTELVRETFGP